MLERKSNVAEGTFSLIIRGEALPFETLRKQLELGEVKIVRKGEELNRLPLIVATEDEMVYTISLTEPEGEDPALTALLLLLHKHAADMAEIKQRYKVNLRMYVQSDKAHIAYRLMPETLEKLVATGLPLDLTNLSWGEFYY